jgi:hypothetical protein
MTDVTQDLLFCAFKHYDYRIIRLIEPHIVGLEHRDVRGATLFLRMIQTNVHFAM